MRTPRMKEILKQTYPGVIKLREYAGYTGSRSRKNECGTLRRLLDRPLPIALRNLRNANCVMPTPRQQFSKTAINLSAMPDRKEMNLVLFQVELINDSIIANTGTESVQSL
jgi:hypothetical protein